MKDKMAAVQCAAKLGRTDLAAAWPDWSADTKLAARVCPALGPLDCTADREPTEGGHRDSLHRAPQRAVTCLTALNPSMRLEKLRAAERCAPSPVDGREPSRPVQGVGCAATY